MTCLRSLSADSDGCEWTKKVPFEETTEIPLDLFQYWSHWKPRARQRNRFERWPCLISFPLRSLCLLTAHVAASRHLGPKSEAVMLQYLVSSLRKQSPQSRWICLGDFNVSQCRTVSFWDPLHRLTCADVDLAKSAQDQSRLEVARRHKKDFHKEFAAAITPREATNLSCYDLASCSKVCKKLRCKLERKGLLRGNKVTIVKTFSHNDNIWVAKENTGAHGPIKEVKVYKPPLGVLKELAEMSKGSIYHRAKNIYSDHLLVSCRCSGIKSM